jgi:hypothetical protein
MDQSHRIWHSNGSVANVARLVESPGGAVALPDRPFALDRSWLFGPFLQRNISQANNC